MQRSVILWRRLDLEGLERLELLVGDGDIRVNSTVLCNEAGGYRLDHAWLLDREWRTRKLAIEKWSDDGRSSLAIERHGENWWVNGKARADLEGADEPDVSVTPFCNTLPIRALGESLGAERVIDTVYCDGSDLSVRRSRQRYVRKSPGTVRYIDMGLFAGFEADLQIDRDGIVEIYQGLFERLKPRP